MDGSWTPLEDEYEEYKRQVEEAAIEGLLRDPDEAKKHGYPQKLHLSDGEKEELAIFISHRLNEAFETFQTVGVQPPLLGQLLLNSILSGMCWERERIGN